MGAFWELQDLSRWEEPVSTIIHILFTSIEWVGALLEYFGLLARSPQLIARYIIRGLLPLNKWEQRGTTNRASRWAPSLPAWPSCCTTPASWASAPGSISICQLHPSSSNYPANKVYKEVTSIQDYFLYNKQERQ